MNAIRMGLRLLKYVDAQTCLFANLKQSREGKNNFILIHSISFHTLDIAIVSMYHF